MNDTPRPSGDQTSPGSRSERAEWHALGRLFAWGTIFVLWALWFLSLQMAPFMFFAFDSEVSVREGIVYGLIQATWVAVIPILLLFAGHIVANGWTWPEWRIRWLAVGIAAALWCAILAFWILTAATDQL